MKIHDPYNEPIEERPPWLAAPWVQADTLHLLDAPPGTGKSALLTAFAVAVASRGELPLTETQPRRRRVLFVALDGAPWDYGSLYRRIFAGQGASYAKPHRGWEVGYIFDRFNIIKSSALPQALDSAREYRGTVTNLTPDGEEYIEAILGARPELLIIDSLRRVHDLDENDSGAMTAIMDRLEAIRDAGTAVIVAHHPPKGGGDARGSGAIQAAADIHIRLRASRRKVGNNAQLIKAEWVKGRGPDIPLEMRYRTHWDADTYTFARVENWTPQPGRVYTWDEAVEESGLAGQDLRPLLVPVPNQRNAWIAKGG